MKLHDVLLALCAGCNFLAIAGVAGAIDTDVLTGETFLYAGILMLFGALCGILSGMVLDWDKGAGKLGKSGKRKSKRHTGKHTDAA